MPRSTHDGWLATFAAALAISIATSNCAADEEIVVGHTVVMMARADVVLRRAPSADAPASWEPPIACTLPVLDVKGDWVETTDGWARRADLVLTDSAVDYFSREIDREPSPFAYASRASILAMSDARESQEKALADAEAAVRAAPSWPVGYQVRGDALRVLGRYAESISNYDRALEIGAPFIESYAGRAKVHRRRLELDEAIEDVHAALRLAPENARALTYLAMLECQNGMHDQAVERLKALRDRAKVPWWHLNKCLAIALAQRGEKRSKTGDFFAALPDLTEALALDPDRPNLHRLRGIALMAVGERAAGIASLSEAVRRDPNDGVSHGALALALGDQSEYDAVIEHASDAMRLGFVTTEVLAARGLAWIGKSENGRAIADFDEAIRVARGARQVAFPLGNRARARLRLALLDGDAGALDSALEDSRRAVELDPKNPTWHTILASVWYVRRDAKRAIAECNTTIELDERYADAYMVRGGALTADERYADAHADLTKAIALGSEDGGCYVMRAACRRRLRDLDGALRDADRGVRICASHALGNEAHAQAHETRAEVLRALGRDVEADSDIRTAAKLRSPSSHAE